MIQLLKTFVTVSLLVPAHLITLAGPVQHVKRQDVLTTIDAGLSSDSFTSTLSSSTDASDTFSTSSTVTASDAFPTSSVSASDTFSYTPSDSESPTTYPTITGSVTPSPTTDAPNTSFTPFTGTFASAVPAVSAIDSWMSAHPDARTRSFTIPYGTSPGCHTTTHPTTYQNSIPVYTGTTTDSIGVTYPVPTNTAYPSFSDGGNAPYPSGYDEPMPSEVPTPGDDSPFPTGDAGTATDDIPYPTGSASELPSPTSDVPSPSDASPGPGGTETFVSVPAPTETPDVSGGDSIVPTSTDIVDSENPIPTDT